MNPLRKLLCHYYLIYNYKYVYVENNNEHSHILCFSRKVDVEKYVRYSEKVGTKLTLKPITITPDFWGID